MSTRSARINILVSPEEKAAIEAMAANRELSVSEHMREAGLAFDDDLSDSDFTAEQEEEIFALCDQLDEVAERSAKRLDDLNESLAEKRQARNAFRVAHGHAPI